MDESFGNSSNESITGVKVYKMKPGKYDLKEEFNDVIDGLKEEIVSDELDFDIKIDDMEHSVSNNKKQRRKAKERKLNR